MYDNDSGLAWQEATLQSDDNSVHNLPFRLDHPAGAGQSDGCVFQPQNFRSCQASLHGAISVAFRFAVQAQLAAGGVDVGAFAFADGCCNAFVLKDLKELLSVWIAWRGHD